MPLPPPKASGRLAALKLTPDCLIYCENEPFESKHDLRISIYGIVGSREIFVELTNGGLTQVKTFESCLKASIGRPGAEIAIADMHAAFALARKMAANRWSPFRAAGKACP